MNQKYFYVLKFPTSFKFGITKDLNVRCQQHNRDIGPFDYDASLSCKSEKSSIVALESALKALFYKQISENGVSHPGHTETLSNEYFDLFLKAIDDMRGYLGIPVLNKGIRKSVQPASFIDKPCVDTEQALGIRKYRSYVRWLRRNQNRFGLAWSAKHDCVWIRVEHGGVLLEEQLHSIALMRESFSVDESNGVKHMGLTGSVRFYEDAAEFQVFTNIPIGECRERTKVEMKLFFSDLSWLFAYPPMYDENRDIVLTREDYHHLLKSEPVSC